MVRKLVAFRLDGDALFILDWAKSRGEPQVRAIEKALALYYAVEKSKEMQYIPTALELYKKKGVDL